jgi:hypothetical protein
MQQEQWLEFQDISTPVVTRGCDELPAVITRVMRTWTFEQTGPKTPATPRLIEIERSPEGYRMTSPWLRQPLTRRDPVDLVCALVIELIWAYLEDHPASLCLHGAAAEFAGRLVVFPNKYRAGKSLLTGCLAASGHRVFTDDILPVEVTGSDRTICGVATGIAPRLRLPLPEALASLAAGGAQHGIADRRVCHSRPPGWGNARPGAGRRGRDAAQRGLAEFRPDHAIR